jgi:hypothetical protein
MIAAVRRTWMVAALALALAGIFALSQAQAASAYYSFANRTGLHYVCAQSLTHYLFGGTVTLHRGHPYRVTDILDGVAWGYNDGGRWGYVYNGWFCEPQLTGRPVVFVLPLADWRGAGARFVKRSVIDPSVLISAFV